MGRNLRCVLLGLAVVGAVCLLVITRGKGVLMKNVGVESRDPSTGATQESNTPTGTDFQRVNSSNAGPKSCSCNHSSDSIGPFGGSGAEDRRATGVPADPTGIDNGRSAVGSRVVLLTSMRTGSSFIGEIFGRNDDIFYLFEPGLALLTELHSQGALFLQPIYMDMLSAIFHCNTSSLNFYIKWLSRQYPLEVKKKVPRLFDLVCYKWPTGRTGLACRKIDADLFERKCREKRHIAVKSIRIWDIGMFQPLIQDGNVKLKVVHLVRDPRGMTASRVLAMNFVDSTMNKLEAGSFTDEMQLYLMEYCSYSIDNKEIGYYHPEYRNNYFLLRYEDMALDPERVTQLIYNFTGFDAVPENVSKWIAENTKAEKPGIYSTTRVSSMAYQSWRTKIDFKTAKAIEKIGRCAEMMEHFGYLPVRDESHLKDLSSSLLAPIPPPHDSQRYHLE